MTIEKQNLLQLIVNLLLTCLVTYHLLMCLPTGQWHLIRTQPAPTTPPYRPPALCTPLTTTPGITLALQPRRSHWIEASGRLTSPQELEGPQQEGDMRPPSAGPPQDTVCRLVEIQQLTGRGSSPLRTTGPDTGRFANSWVILSLNVHLNINLFGTSLLEVISEITNY